LQWGCSAHQKLAIMMRYRKRTKRGSIFSRTFSGNLLNIKYKSR
jgi:hypothetical protein